MPIINPSLPILNQPESTEDPKTLNALTVILNLLNGGLDTANFADLGIQTVDLADAIVTLAKLAPNSVDASKVVDGSLGNAEISATAAIAKSKLAALAIVNADVAAGAAIAYAKLALTNSVVSADLVAAHLDQVGVTGGGVTRSGKSIIATSEARANAAYGTLTTPDQVAGIVLPTDGLIMVMYRAIWQESVDGAARAAIFVGANQLQVAGTNGGGPAAQETACGGNAATDAYMHTFAGGLENQAAGASAYTGDVATGQAVGRNNTGSGGFCYIEAAAGTYTISVQFKASSGSVTVKNRKLWVRAVTFA